MPVALTPLRKAVVFSEALAALWHGEENGVSDPLAMVRKKSVVCW